MLSLIFISYHVRRLIISNYEFRESFADMVANSFGFGIGNGRGIHIIAYILLFVNDKMVKAQDYNDAEYLVRKVIEQCDK